MTPHEALKKYWHYDAFRPLQEDIIRSVLDGKDTLALLPTGGGKSICFQVPALCRDGICLVVSPLIALMKDQVYNLKKRGIQAEAIYSGLSSNDIDRILDNAVYGNVKFLYLSPERLTTELAIERIKKMNVSLLAIDEAHCVSQWGYDFRPPYLCISDIRVHLPKTPILALTATATPDVVIDIQEKLAFKMPNVFQKSFARSNLAYVVIREERKVERAIEILKKVPGSGIIYVRNRKKTKDIALTLQQAGISADFFHAGLTADERSAKQDAWISDKTRIIVSTNAFGMGIDKPDVRVVIHVDVPDCIEAYFQEAGRGGRDEKKAFATLLFTENDMKALVMSIENQYPDLKNVRQVYRALGSYFQLGIGSGAGQSFDFDLTEFCTNFRFDNQYTVHNILRVLEQAGWLVLSESVYIPSSLWVKVNREVLYSFQLRHKKVDALLKTLVRAYEGIFNQAVYINEGKIANLLNIKTIELIALFDFLQKESIIAYYPKKEKPQVTFLKERLNADDITFDMKRYDFLKDRHRFRIERMIHYTTTTACRNKLLLQYFGEKDGKDCGECDFCLKNKSLALSDETFERYKVKIFQMLEKDNLTMSQVIDSFAIKRQPQIVKVLTFLLDEKTLLLDGEKIKVASRERK